MISSFWYYDLDEVEVAIDQGAMETVLGAFGQRIDSRQLFRRFA